MTIAQECHCGEGQRARCSQDFWQDRYDVTHKRPLMKTGDTSTDLIASKLHGDKLPPTQKKVLSKMAVLNFKPTEAHVKCPSVAFFVCAEGVGNSKG